MNDEIVGNLVIGNLVTDNDDLIMVMRYPSGETIVKVSQGISEPEKMATYFFQLTSAEVEELKALL